MITANEARKVTIDAQKQKRLRGIDEFVKNYPAILSDINHKIIEAAKTGVRCILNCKFALQAEEIEYFVAVIEREGYTFFPSGDSRNSTANIEDKVKILLHNYEDLSVRDITFNLYW